MKIPILKILVGIPASGKSTWAKQFVLKNDNWCIVSRDDFRYGWRNTGVCDPKIESTITEMVENSIETLIGRGINVIYDATNLKSSYLKTICDLVAYTANVEYQIFDVDLDTAILRDSNRDRSVGASVVRKMYDQYRCLLDSYDFSFKKRRPKKYIDPILENPAIIVDIDGTLAHMGYRSPYDYDNVSGDQCDLVVKTIVNKLYSYFTIFIVTGRPESCRKLTETWLNDNEISYSRLLMRSDEDSRKDSIIKEEIFWRDIAPLCNVIGVFDDRNQVVKMWRSMGIKCFQCEYGNF